MKTVLQVSKELNITPQAVYKKINKQLLNLIKPFVTKDDKGNILIADEGIEMIKTSLQNQKTVVEPFTETVLVETLLNEIDFLKNQINSKDKQLNEATNRLKEKDEFMEFQTEKNTKLLENMQVLLKQQQEIVVLCAPKSNVTIEEDLEENEKNFQDTNEEKKITFLDKIKYIFK